MLLESTFRANSRVKLCAEHIRCQRQQLQPFKADAPASTQV